MTEEIVPVNYNDPRAYLALKSYLDNPAAFPQLGHSTLRDLQASLDVVLAMPEGDGRCALLKSLNSGLTATRRRFELYDGVNALHRQLKAERPDMAELGAAADLIKRYGQMFISKFKQAYDIEAKKGNDMWKTAWPWYEHELYSYVPALVRCAETVARIAQEPASVSGLPPVMSLEPEDFNQ